jgi:hypothetical protein
MKAGPKGAIKVAPLDLSALPEDRAMTNEDSVWPERVAVRAA